MKSFIQKIIAWTKVNKILGITVLIAIIGMGYGIVRAFSGDFAETRYVIAAVERGNIIVSVSSSGQVTASSQLDIKSKISGEIIAVNVKAGQEVKAGTVIAQIDSRDALEDVRDAEADLTSARISLEKTKTSAAQSKEDAEESLTKAYEDGYSKLTDAFTNYSEIIDDIYDLFYDKNHSPYMGQENLRFEIGYSAIEERDKVGAQFDKIKKEYDSLFREYEKLSRSSSPEDIENLVDNTYTFSKRLTDALKGVQTFLAYIEKRLDTIPGEFTEDKTSVNEYVSTVNGKVSDFFSFQGTVKSAKADLATINQTYSQISGSIDPIDVQTAQLTVTQRQNAYQKALNTLSDYTIRAAFDSVIATVPVKKGDSASSGTTIATLMTKQQIATISLNEIDIAKVKSGQKATLSFDAVEDLIISGQVLEVDAIGTISQGVVNYNVKIGFDTYDEKIKPGMTVSASIVTDMKPNVLMVPLSAVKTQGGISYVEIVDQVPSQNQTSQAAGVVLSALPRRVEVTTGLVNDEFVEIISGLEEGNRYVARIITTGIRGTQTTQSAPSLFGGNTGRSTVGTGGAGNFRTFTR